MFWLCVKGTYVIVSPCGGSRIFKESARLLEHELQLDEFGVRAAKFVAVRVHFEKFTFQALELHLELVEIEGSFQRRVLIQSVTGLLNLICEEPKPAGHFFAPLHLVGVRALKWTLVRVEVLELQQPELWTTGNEQRRRVSYTTATATQQHSFAP